MRSIVGLLLLVLAACERAEDTQPPPKPDPLAGVELPEVSGAGSIAGDAGASPLVVVTPSALTIDGAPVLTLRDGAVDAADKEGGALGMKIPKLVSRLASVTGSHDATVTVAIDRRLTYRLLVEVLFSAKQREAGWKRFAVLARANGKLVAFPITLPDKTHARGIAVGGSKYEADETSLTATDVLRKIQRSYLAGIKRCYKQLLAKQPSAAGKLTLRLTVTATGQVTAPSARGLPAMERCVTDAMASWRFPVPRDTRGTPTEATFETTLRFTSADDPEPTPPAVLVQPEPSSAPLAPPDQDAAAQDPRIAIAMTKTELVLWSFTGLEGTLQNPKLELARSDASALPKLAAGLDEIVRRRWGTGTRPETTRAIVIVADSATSLQAVADVFGVARTAFPDLVLASGFE
jgi:hypothetical protein